MAPSTIYHTFTRLHKLHTQISVSNNIILQYPPSSLKVRFKSRLPNSLLDQPNIQTTNKKQPIKHITNMDAQAFTNSSDDFEDYFNFEDWTYSEKEVRDRALDYKPSIEKANSSSQNTMRNLHQDVSADTSLATTPAKNKQDYTVVNDKEKPEQPELQESNLTELDSALDSELFGDEEDEDDDTELENALIDALNMPESKDEALSEQAFLSKFTCHLNSINS